MQRTIRTLLPLLLAAPLAARPGPPVPSGPTAPAGARAPGRVYLTVDEALALAFPKCTITREKAYLTEKEEARAEELAGFEIESGVVRPYEAFDAKGAHVGTAYFDSHRVRTLKETLMVVVDPESRIRRIEILAFAEPEEYLPRGSQFLDKSIGPELRLKRAIQPVTGATLTARATTEAARRVLALHQVVGERRPEG